LTSGRLLFATVLHLDGEGIVGVYRLLNPAKLAGLGHPMFLDNSES